jgi:hypothetical protein
MKAYIIQNGHFSKAGNFIAFSTLGERIHIYKKQINRLFPDRQVKFPFYCMADHLTFDNTDGTTFTRLTATEIHSSNHAIKAKAELQSTIEYYERQLKYYRTELEDARRGLETYRELYNNKAEDYDALVAKVDHYGGNAGLKEENEKLKDYFKALQWENEHIQSERERLALIIMNASKVVASCDLGLSQEKINQLINNA